MSIDPAKMADIAERLVFVHVEAAHGADGTSALRQLLDVVRRTYSQVSTERLPSGVSVLVPVRAGEAWLVDVVEIRRQEELLDFADGPLTVELTRESRMVAAAVETDPMAPGNAFLIYRWSPVEGEHVFVEGKPFDMPNPTGASTALATPYFFDLSDALSFYETHFAKRPGQCVHLDGAWREEERVVLLPRPEVLMRKSLHRHLKSSLRNVNHVEVMAEQVVDESHPVDLKVTWIDSNKVALIEIKWLGVSGPPTGGTPTTKYPESRAVSGAQQLAGYLDSYKSYSAGQDVRGYLTVFDGRRRNVDSDTVAVSREDGFYYKYREVTYPSNVLQRGDYENPFRFFMEPVPARQTQQRS